MIRTLAFALAALASSVGTGWADGFAVRDLQTLSVDTSGYTGDSTFDYGAREPNRLTVFCAECSTTTAIDVIIARSEDGTEERYRSGETTIEKMEAQCKARSPSCELEASQLGDAVGWVTRYEVGGRAGSTTVLFLDGDQLIIRSIAGDLETAFANGQVAVATIGRSIVRGE
ncbi:MAG: hypothetical protein AAGD13_17615 [Pseudomonadota bacterium]